MEACCELHLSNFEVNNEVIKGHIKGENLFNDFINSLKKIGYSFATRNSKNVTIKNYVHLNDHNYVSTDSSDVVIHYDKQLKSYFYISRRDYMKCIHGHHYYKKESLHKDHPTGKKSRFYIQNTKKLDCPAIFHVIEKIHFIEEDLNIVDTTPSAMVKDMILKRISRGDSPKTIKIFHISLSVSTIHNHRITEQTMTIHPEIKKRIEDLVHNEFTAIRDIKLHLREKVNEMFPSEDKPSRMNTAYFPSDSVIYYHIYNTLFKIKKSKFDQEALTFAIDSWQQDSPESNFFFRPYSEGGEPLLFCYQASWQKKMMLTYGNNICLLDATYKTMKYALPLFFIVVKTNLKYCIVGTFVCHSEAASNIIEALKIFSQWNPEWNPPFFMTDYSEAEINALELVFPKTTVYLCDFHREQAWQRWTKKAGNITYGTQENILQLFRAVANADTIEEYEEIIKKLECDDLWGKNEKVMKYFQNMWLAVKERWVPCFMDRTYTNNVRTNNGIEVQNRVLKHSYLNKTVDKSLTGVMKVIINEYFVITNINLIKENVASSSECKAYNEAVPSFLHNRPHKYIKHVLPRYEAAMGEFNEDSIREICENILIVKSQNSVEYVLDFNDVKCTCADFKKFKQLCKHFCACFIYSSSHRFESLPAMYKDNPLFNLDTGTSMTLSSSVPVCSNESRGTLENNAIEASGNSDLKKIREIFKQAIDATYDVTDTSNMEVNIRKSLEVLNDLRNRTNKSNENIAFLKNKRKRHNDNKCNEKKIKLNN